MMMVYHYKTSKVLCSCMMADTEWIRISVAELLTMAGTMSPAGADDTGSQC